MYITISYQVHDTACWHYEISSLEDQNLNSVLSQNGLQPNMMRDSSV